MTPAASMSVYTPKGHASRRPPYSSPTLLSPALTHTQAVFATSSRLLAQATLFLLQYTLIAAQLLSSNLVLVLFVVATQLDVITRLLWRSTERVRAKIFFEFMVWILNPYAVSLFVFWPGWIVIGMAWFWWRFSSYQ